VNALEIATGDPLLQATPINYNARPLGHTARGVQESRNNLQTFTVGGSNMDANVVYVQYNGGLDLTAQFTLFETSSPNGSPPPLGATLVSGTLDFNSLSGAPTSGGVLAVHFNTLTLNANQAYGFAFNTAGGSQSFGWSASGAAGGDMTTGRYSEPGNIAEGFAHHLINDGGFGIGIAANPVPEPSTFILFGLGLIGVGGQQWRKRRKTSIRSYRE
jgi:hypothetical protein